MALTYIKEKKKYGSLMQKEAEAQIKKTQLSDLPREAVYNKFELHDARILIGVITDLLLKKKIISRKELEKDIVSAYEDELKQLKSAKNKKR